MATKTAAGKKKGLGMGLSALLGTEADNFSGDDEPHRILQIGIEFLKPSPHQPRRRFDQDELESLSQSIAEKGILQPLVVRALDHDAGTYEIIAGERRWRAAQMVGLTEVPSIVHDLNDRAVIEVALIENIQREDLSALEEAEAYQRLIDLHGHTQDAVARAVGKSRSHIANTMRLLSLSADIQDLLLQGKLSAGHARALLASPTPREHAHLIIANDLNVREAELLVKKPAQTKKQSQKRQADPNIADMEFQIAQRLGLSVSIQQKRNGGTLTIRYREADQLNALLNRLG